VVCHGNSISLVHLTPSFTHEPVRTINGEFHNLAHPFLKRSNKLKRFFDTKEIFSDETNAKNCDVIRIVHITKIFINSKRIPFHYKNPFWVTNNP